MKISYSSKLEQKSVLTIFCDGSPWRDIHTAVFGRRPVLPQGCESLIEFSEQFSVLECRQAKNYAIRRLSLQGMLSTALVRALKDRLVSEKAIREAVGELTDLGFVNDEEWAASYVRSQNNKKVGPRAIAQKLAHKGVRGERLEQALEKSRDPEEQKILIQSLLKSKYAKRNLSDFKEKQKVIASLVRRGFDMNIIFTCLNYSEF